MTLSEKFRSVFNNKKSLYFALFFLLLVIIVLSLNFLLNFFSPQPATHSVIRFNSEDVQKVSTNDILTGRGIVGSSVRIVFTPSNKESDIKTATDKQWSFSIPNYLQNRNYFMSLLFLDKENHLIAIKTYNLQIIPHNIFDSIKRIFNVFNPRSANAQEIKNDYEFSKWSARMRTVYQIYPYIENGEILLLNKEQYEKKTGCDKNPCLEAAPDTTDLIDYSRKNKDFLDRLLEKLANSGYSPIEVLLPYIPELNNPPYVIAGPPFSKWQRILPKPGTKTEIDEDTLRQFIYEVSKEKYCGSRDLELCEKSSLQIALIKTDPILGLNSIAKVVSLPPNKVTDDERLNAFLAMDLYFGLAKFVSKIGINAVSKVSFNVLKTAEEGTVIRNSIKSGDSVPLPALSSRANQWVNQSSKRNFADYWNPRSPLAKWNATLVRNARPSITNMSATERFYISTLNALIDQKKAFVLDQSITKPILDRFLQALARVKDGELARRGLIPKDKIYETVNNSLIIVVEDDQLLKLSPHGRDFAADRTVVLSTSTLADPDLENIIDHELVHVMRAYNNLDRALGVKPIGKYFAYNQNQADLYGRIMSIIFEISTDDILGAIKGVRQWTPAYITGRGYKYVYPSEFIFLDDLANRMQQLGGEQFSKVDFLEFALTGDDQKLISKILSNRSPDKITINEFLQMLNQNASDAEIARLYQVVSTVDWQAMQQHRDQFAKQMIPIAAATGTGVATIELILMNEAFSLTSQGKPLPPNDVIINIPLIANDKPEYSIIITGVVGEIRPLSYIDVSSITAFGGQSVKEGGIIQIWSLLKTDERLASTVSQVKPLRGGEHCLDSCRITLPANLGNEEYKLVAYLTKYGSDQILATDVYRINQGIKTIGIKSIKINDIEKSIDELKDDFILFLPTSKDKTEKVSIPIVINYEDGSIRPTALFFLYQPSDSCNPNDQSTWTKLYSECDNSGPGMVHEAFKDCKGDFHTINVQFQKGACGDNSSEIPTIPAVKCKDPYPQCGSTIGLDDYPATDTILVTPVCDGTGKIIDYKKENLGNRGECKNTEPEVKFCDNLYYYDTNVDSCIHKFSRELYPDCNYIFDHVERNYCGL